MHVKNILATAALTLFFYGFAIGQDDILGTWNVKLDNFQDSGDFKGKDVATIEIKKDGETYYFVGKGVKNGYPDKCMKCPEDMKGKSATDGKTRWGDRFNWNAKENKFVGGDVVQVHSGKRYSDLAFKYKVLNKKVMHLIGVNEHGKKRVFVLTR